MEEVTPIKRRIDDFYVYMDENSVSSNLKDSPFLLTAFERLRYLLFKLYIKTASRRLKELEVNYLGSDFAPLSDYGRAFAKKVRLERKMHENILKIVKTTRAELLQLPFECLVELYYWHYTIEQRLFLNTSESIFRVEAAARRRILNRHEYVIKGFDEKNSPAYGYKESGFERPSRWFTFFDPPNRIRFGKPKHTLIDKGYCPFYYYVQMEFRKADLEGGSIDAFLQHPRFSRSGLSIETNSEMLFNLFGVDSRILPMYYFIEGFRA